MPTAPRVLWKGAISFGLVHIPVSLHTATTSSGVDFDWLDKRSMDPVGYKRINKKTGKEIEKQNIVKGIEYDEGQYVVLTDEEIKAAYPKSTQSIDIEAFVPASEIPFVYLERPYYLAPIGKGAKVYAFKNDVMALVEKKVEAGQTETVVQPEAEEAAPSKSAEIIDLAELLKRSLRRGDGAAKAPPARRAAARKSAAKSRASAKPASKSSAKRRAA